MNFRLLPALALSLTLAACQATVPLTQSLQKPAQSVSATEQVHVSLGEISRFHAAFANSSLLAYIKISVSGQGLSSPVSADGVAFLPVSGGSLTATISNLPISDGGIRVVTAKGYDANQNELPAYELKGWYISHSAGGSTSVTVSKRYYLLGKIIEDLTANNPTLLAKLDLSALQSVLETMSGYNATIGTFATSPSLYGLSALIAALPADGSTPTASALSTAALGSTGSANIAYQTPNGKKLDEDVVFAVDDPASTPVVVPRLSASFGNVGLTGLQPGSWTLEARTQAGTLLGSTTATVTTGGGVSFGNLTLTLTGVKEIPDEFRVNTYTTAAQGAPSVGMDASGNYVVAWQSTDQDGSGNGIYAQRYNAAGVPQGAEFKVNTYTTNPQLNPSVAVDADGDFVVAWESYGEGELFKYENIYAQRYNAAGVAQGGEILVNSHTTNSQRNPAVAIDKNGNFVVAWDDFGVDGSGKNISARRFNSDGSAVAADFVVNTTTTDDQYNPAIAMDDNGDFAIAWQSGASGATDIYARRYNSAGVAQGNDFLVNTYTTSVQISPAIAMDSTGNFVVAWHSQQDGDGYGIYAQRYAAAGSPQGSEFRVNTYTTDNQVTCAVAMNAGGEFVVSWESGNQDGSGSGIYAQRYTSGGTAQGGEFRANAYTTDAQTVPSLRLDAAGNFVLAWQSGGQDGADNGIYAQSAYYLSLPR